MKIDTEILCSFIDGELDAATAAAVRTALDADEKLRQEYEDLRKTSELVGGLPKVSAPPELLEAITANAEREQLLGRTRPTPTGRTGLYWGLSVAASLMIGATLGVLGYHGLRGEAELGGGPTPLVVQVKHELGDLPEAPYAGKGDSLARTNDGLVVGRSSSSRGGGEEIAALTKSGRRVTSGKSGMRIPRSGPVGGTPAKSIGGAFEDEGRLTGQPAGPGMADAIAMKEEGQQQPEPIESFGYDRNLTAKGAPADVVMAGDIEACVRTKAGEPLPLEIQVRSNNFVNQNMAANQRFEAEPVNVKVLSKDTTKTLQYVRQWALNNSLIDLNKASPEVNFPVYTQVVYQGKPGANITPANEKGILLRTTRSQARQIVTELQKQEPLVLSVSVRDKKNSLGFPVKQIERETLDLAGRAKFGMHQRQEITADSQMAETAKPKMATQTNASLPGRLRDSDDTDGSGVAELQVDQVGTMPPTRGMRTKADEYYLFQITNQMQVHSLEDLITLVVLVADASCPTELRQSLQITGPLPTEPEASESE